MAYHADINYQVPPSIELAWDGAASCPHCKSQMLNPCTVSPCNCVVCTECANALEQNPSCPVCKKETDGSSLDRDQVKLIKENCRASCNQCSWKGTFLEAQKHFCDPETKPRLSFYQRLPVPGVPKNTVLTHVIFDGTTMPVEATTGWPSSSEHNDPTGGRSQAATQVLCCVLSRLEREQYVTNRHWVEGVVIYTTPEEKKATQAKYDKRWRWASDLLGLKVKEDREPVPVSERSPAIVQCLKEFKSRAKPAHCAWDPEDDEEEDEEEEDDFDEEDEEEEQEESEEGEEGEGEAKRKKAAKQSETESESEDLDNLSSDDDEEEEDEEGDDNDDDFETVLSDENDPFADDDGPKVPSRLVLVTADPTPYLPFLKELGTEDIPAVCVYDPNRCPAAVLDRIDVKEARMVGRMLDRPTTEDDPAFYLDLLTCHRKEYDDVDSECTENLGDEDLVEEEDALHEAQGIAARDG